MESDGMVYRALASASAFVLWNRSARNREAVSGLASNEVYVLLSSEAGVILGRR